MPTPPAGQLLQRTSILKATMFRLKHDVRSVSTKMEDSSPIMNHGSMFDGVLGPPASKPEAMDPGAGYAKSEWWHVPKDYEV